MQVKWSSSNKKKAVVKRDGKWCEIRTKKKGKVTITAKYKGKKKKWYKKQELYWNGEVYKRDSIEYQNLLNRAYNSLFENKSFRIALLSTGNSKLEHSIGKIKESETVLTRSEFCNRLTYLRDKGKLPKLI